jgi:hypothetical protein
MVIVIGTGTTAELSITTLIFSGIKILGSDELMTGKTNDKSTWGQ